MAITSKNAYLTRAEMEENAAFIWSVFTGNGWSETAVAAMLGNMESESTINPGIYENLDDSSILNGFGLVQWTPGQKYREWADANGYGSDYGDILGQIARIKYEVENGLQWIPTSSYNMTFAEFTTSTLSPEYLAQAFLHNYERPADLNQPKRSTQARAWFDLFNENGGGVITPTEPARAMSKLLLYFAGTRRR